MIVDIIIGIIKLLLEAFIDVETKVIDTPVVDIDLADIDRLRPIHDHLGQDGDAGAYYRPSSVVHSDP